MAEIDVAGIKIKGGKLLIILPIIKFTTHIKKIIHI